LTGVSTLCWPLSGLPEGLELLARSAGYPVRRSGQPPASTPGCDLENNALHIAALMGLELEPVDTTFGGVKSLLLSAGPAIIRVGPDALVFLVGSRGRKAKVIARSGRPTRTSCESLVQMLTTSVAAPAVADVEKLVETLAIPQARHSTVVSAMLAERLGAVRLPVGWLLRIPPGGSFRAQLVAKGVHRQLLWLGFAYAAHQGLVIASWWLLGRAALDGHLDRAWLAGWGLALFTLILVQVLAVWLQGKAAIAVGALLKKRLLVGALSLNPDKIRHEGAGHLLGRVIETEAVESLAIGGGFTSILAGVELIAAACVLAIAAPFLALLLVMWAVLTVVPAAVFCQRRLHWVRARLYLTLDLIERMIGHRTRITQQRPQDWHAGEDEALESYVLSSASMDRASIWLLSVAPRGWMLVGLCGVAALFIPAASTVSVAIGLGGVLLGFRAFQRLSSGLSSLVGAALAWRQAAPLFNAANREADSVHLDASSEKSLTPALLEATDLRFTHSGRREPTLRGCTLSLQGGERVILEGSSGSGKSTFASILAGLRLAESGLLLIGGLDCHTLGPEGWRQRVVLVPQFHENHIALGSLAFNVLMGVGWPPSKENLRRADTVLRDLGLGEMLERMPGGLFQTVGETGWQLSHGERSRVYLARALLQNPEVLIVDESFAELDALNTQRALDTVLARRMSVLLIAHP